MRDHFNLDCARSIRHPAHSCVCGIRSPRRPCSQSSRRDLSVAMPPERIAWLREALAAVRPRLAGMATPCGPTRCGGAPEMRRVHRAEFRWARRACAGLAARSGVAPEHARRLQVAARGVVAARLHGDACAARCLRSWRSDGHASGRVLRIRAREPSARRVVPTSARRRPATTWRLPSHARRARARRHRARPSPTPPAPASACRSSAAGATSRRARRTAPSRVVFGLDELPPSSRRPTTS